MLSETEEERERNIDWLPPVYSQTRDHSARTRDQTLNLAKCHDGELNPQRFGCWTMFQPTEPHWPGHTYEVNSLAFLSTAMVVLMKIISSDARLFKKIFQNIFDRGRTTNYTHISAKHYLHFSRPFQHPQDGRSQNRPFLTTRYP